MAVKEGNYKIEVNSLKKVINMVITGTFTPEKAKAFINDYQKKVNSIKASDFELKLDCTDLDVVTQAMIPELTKCYELYKSSGFNKVVFEIKSSNIVKMQLGRIARNVGLTNAQIVEV